MTPPILTTKRQSHDDVGESDKSHRSDGSSSLRGMVLFLMALVALLAASSTVLAVMLAVRPLASTSECRSQPNPTADISSPTIHEHPVASFLSLVEHDPTLLSAVKYVTVELEDASEGEPEVMNQHSFAVLGASWTNATSISFHLNNGLMFMIAGPNNAYIYRASDAAADADAAAAASAHHRRLGRYGLPHLHGPHIHTPLTHVHAPSAPKVDFPKPVKVVAGKVGAIMKKIVKGEGCIDAKLLCVQKIQDEDITYSLEGSIDKVCDHGSVPSQLDVSVGGAFKLSVSGDAKKEKKKVIKDQSKQPKMQDEICDETGVICVVITAQGAAEESLTLPWTIHCYGKPSQCHLTLNQQTPPVIALSLSLMVSVRWAQTGSVNLKASITVDSSGSCKKQIGVSADVGLSLGLACGLSYDIPGLPDIPLAGTSLKC